MASPSALLAIDGVGEQSATLVKGAASDIAASLRSSSIPRLKPSSADELDQALLAAVVNLDDLLRMTRSVESDLIALVDQAPVDLEQAMRVRSLPRWLLARPASRDVACAAAERLEMLVAQHSAAVEEVARSLPALRETSGVLEAFHADPARYQSVLDSQVGERATALSGLSQELADAIQAFPLDVSALRVMLRRYQEFGAKFILTQRRVLLGDDMGLGKTVQALAALAHLSNEHEHFKALIVAPASVLINWQREIVAKTDLVPAEPEQWVTSGGLLVTTFERLKNVPLEPATQLHLLVVDEAHYVKNPQAQRTQRIHAWLDRADRVLFMTGTAIENRGGEFVDLVRMLDPSVAAHLVGPAALVAPQEFRARVAPLYLRRNADEVLTELPALIEVDEWEEMTTHDFEHYRRAVAEGNLMAMRRAGFMAGPMRRSAKLDRLLELVAEARDSGHKVIVYSYFLDVLQIVSDALPGKTFGPLTGTTAPAARQQLVDDFTAAPAGSVLVAQVIAGGVGLNIQAASVVILCEPQFKPSTENQAIARARRMGQLKAVQVHRLLNPDSIDERVMEILAGKVEVFDTYARESDLAAASDNAVDARTALRLISDERTRLGIAHGTSPSVRPTE